MEYTYKEMRAFAVDFAYYIYANDLSTVSHERYKEHFDDWIKAKLPQADVISSIENGFKGDDVRGSALPEGWLDWNTLSLDQMVQHLRQKYMFSSSGDAKCIYHLIEFYDKHK